MHDLPCSRIECDEISAFCYSKAKNVPAEKRGEFGYRDVWTWVAIDAETKLVPSFHIGSRDAEEASIFMQDLAKRLNHRVQLTTDGHKSYLEAVKGAFRDEIDYAQLVKTYCPDPAGERRYSPQVCTGIGAKKISGDPDPKFASTSYVERQNLIMRMSMRRFTRLTNTFSKKVENLAAAVSFHFMHYNFCRVHKTLGTTPAVAAGLTDHTWTLAELIGLLEQAESAIPMTRGRYQPRKPISN